MDNKSAWWHPTSMCKIEIELPEALFIEANRVARERGMSLTDVVCLGLEHMIRIRPQRPIRMTKWSPPPPSPMGEYRIPPAEWRLLVNDPTLDGLANRE